MGRAPKEPIEVGDEVTVTLGAMVHGGHCLAHPRGHTAFVRHGLPGEGVVIRITEVRSKLVRADVVEVLEASPHRVVPPCSWAHAGGCGGCDFQHVSIAHQRELKGTIAHESLARHGDIDAGALTAQPLAHDDGLHWRTRMRFSVDGGGTAGMLGARSHGVLPVDRCLLASASIDALAIPDDEWRGAQSIEATEDSHGRASIWVDRVLVSGPRKARQQVHHRSWEIDGTAFWQVHPRAAEAIVDHVLAAGAPQPGERWLDLYSGAGLITAFLGEAVGVTGAITAVESHRTAVRDGRRALADLPQVSFVGADVEAWALPDGVDGVVLDPPRRGAGAAVMTAIAQAGPRVIVYVACDPVAFARDAATLGAHGYALDALAVLDAFPMTHHMECIARFVPGSQAAAGQVQRLEANRLP
ncbi:MAG: TRAM domain-containing protein [Candidatus Nanopelagicales bacterium]|nr:TRAM domain-containing protein [Candidatus Nanopelagicales bacterium]